MFLKERSPISVKEVRNLADKYRIAQPSKPIAKEVEIVANVGVTKESKNNQAQFNRTSRRDKWQQNNNQRSSSYGPKWKHRDYAQPNQRFPRWNDSPHNNFRGQNKGNFRGYSQRRPSRGRGMPSRGNYHSQRYEYASSASILFNTSDKTSQHQLNIVPGKNNGTDCTVLRDTGCTCSNGMVERFNGSLKTMLRKLCMEKPQTWDKMIPAVLFAYREIPNVTTGYPPFMLMYGRKVRGPADMIADQYIGQQNTLKEAAFVHEYAKNLQREITDSCRIAAETAKNQLQSYREAKSDHRRYSEFAKGDKVLILLPQDGNNLFMKYQGPYKIDGVAQNNNYVFIMRNGKRTYHANILKKYEEREPSPPLQPVVENACTGFVRHKEYEEIGISMLEPKRKEYPRDVTISEKLTPQQNKEARELLQTFADTLSDIPGKTERVEHKIRLTDETPFRMKQYPLPVHAMDEVDKEINFMLESGIISKSTSPYASPITVVMKKDGAIRLCLDFRKLNKITIFDAQPIPTHYCNNMREHFTPVSTHPEH
ncbi:Gag-Pol polyprotein [Plakobranchus ocellatus]|uniref:Gag-Pol polyprotein n=1 Tax=Plakobranchus ocellatus TaxID=259542 RepID=A0AAV4CQD8_9GAST|nr:Gag-Pol polyprotein [Plakobranchus ocellatus]